MTNTPFRYAICLVCFLFLACSACAPKKKIEPQIPETREISASTARSAWEAENYTRAAEMYEKLLAETAPDRETQNLYYYRLAASLQKTERFHRAEQVLESWSQKDISARTEWRWHEIKAGCLLHTRGREAWIDHLSEVTVGSRYPYPLKKKAAEKLIGYYWEQKNYSSALPIFSELFNRAENKSARKQLQNRALSRLNGLSRGDISKLEKSIRKIERPPRFPYNLLVWSYWLRMAKESPDKWEEIWPRLQSVAYGGDIPDPEPLRAKLRELEEELGEIGRRIALTIPLSGPYSTVGWKIMRGASLAQWELARKGEKIRVKALNTGTDVWAEKLRELDGIRLVGGPLTQKNWEKIKETDENREKAFFTFLSNVEEEGKTGWRFFPSPRDQVRRLILPSMKRLGIKRFAILYPEEDYGRSMARVFLHEARAQGASITGLHSYPPEKPQKWGKSVRAFLQVEDPEDPTQNPEPDFQAVFIPDSFSRAKGVIPYFFFYGEERLLFLGPMLWSQGATTTNLENNYFGLSMTTGPWWPDNPSSSREKLSGLLDKTMQGEPDFWTALGYDFVRHCNRMPNKGIGPDNINETITALPSMQWTMAPITWDNEGKANQNLYVLRLSSSGLNPVHYPSMEALMQRRKIQHANRIEKLEEKKKDSEEAKPETKQTKE